jgi:hypothetical protein
MEEGVRRSEEEEGGEEVRKRGRPALAEDAVVEGHEDCHSIVSSWQVCCGGCWAVEGEGLDMCLRRRTTSEAGESRSPGLLPRSVPPQKAWEKAGACLFRSHWKQGGVAADVLGGAQKIRKKACNQSRKAAHG